MKPHIQSIPDDPQSGLQRLGPRSVVTPGTQQVGPFAPEGVLDGRYRLRRTIGQGGMCVIFEAQQLFTGKLVAIKTLLPELRHSPEARERILREGMVLGAIRHPNVISIEDAGIAPNGSPYLVLEKLEGRALDSILDLRRRISVADALHIAGALAWALAEIHSRGFIHRDIKPSNVVVVHGSEAQGGEQVRVLDFGVATAPDRVDGPPKLTAMGSVVGTPEYLAPEQLLGAPATPLTDVYSVGVLLYECLTGELPFVGDFGARLMQVVTKDAPSVKTFRDDVSEGVASIVARALSRESGGRFETAAKLAEAIDSLGVASKTLHLLRGVPPPLPAAATRQHARAAYASPVQLHIGERRLDGVSADISSGGMLCLIAEHIDIGTRLTLRGSAPFSAEPMVVQGLVRWTRKAERSSRFAVAAGIEFMTVPVKLQRDIDAYVSHIAAPT